MFFQAFLDSDLQSETYIFLIVLWAYYKHFHRKLCSKTKEGLVNCHWTRSDQNAALFSVDQSIGGRPYGLDMS